MTVGVGLAGDLDIRPNRLYFISGQINPVFPGDIREGFQSQRSFKVPVKIDLGPRL
jgi:hypothetical protein